MMGHDGVFSNSQVLRHIHDELGRFQPIAVAITNCRESGAGEMFRRMLTSSVLGHRPRLAASVVRRYSFGGGVVLEGKPSRKAATDALDGSEMYRMHLGTRLVADAGRCLAVRPTCIVLGLTRSGFSFSRFWLMYAAAGTFALSVPIALFDACRPWLYAFAKRIRIS